MKKLISKIVVVFLIIACMVTRLSGSKLVFASGDTENKVQQEGTENTEKKENFERQQPNVDLTCKSAVLMEGSTGTIIYEKDKDLKLNPASITKIMTLLLIFEALEGGKIKLTDEVQVSEYAASMGGSQVYLEPFETQTVDDMIKCISIASANDASVAMAEYIAGSETEFVAKMNERAKELGMNNTNFVNCCGLDVDNHYTTAYDVALMSRELIMKHPNISNYSTVWMDTIIHKTKKGESEFGLTNTNKLVKTYDGITGLKTGSTSLAKYCLSATARRNGMDMIAVVMSAPDYKVRFPEAAKLLDTGFATCTLYKDSNENVTIENPKVKKGVVDEIIAKPKGEFSFLFFNGENKDEVKKDIYITEEITAPLKIDDKVGEIRYTLNGKNLGSVDIVSTQEVKEAKYRHHIAKVLNRFFLINK